MLQENDFIEVEYTGKLKESGMVFDTTDKATAEKETFLIQTLSMGHRLFAWEWPSDQKLDKQLQGKRLEKHTRLLFHPKKALERKEAQSSFN